MWPVVPSKVALMFPEVAPKELQRADITLKGCLSKQPKSHLIFWLLLQENLLNNSFKYRQIWLHCQLPIVVQFLFENCSVKLFLKLIPRGWFLIFVTWHQFCCFQLLSRDMPYKDLNFMLRYFFKKFDWFKFLASDQNAWKKE